MTITINAVNKNLYACYVHTTERVGLCRCGFTFFRSSRRGLIDRKTMNNSLFKFVNCRKEGKC